MKTTAIKYYKLAKIRPTKFWFGALFTTLIIAIFSGAIFTFFGGIEENETVNSIETISLDLLISVLIGPFIETLIFQFLLYRLLSIFFEIKWMYLYIIISSILFSLTHNYGDLYIVYSFLMGLCFSFVFYVYARIKNVGIAFIAVFLIHALINLSSVIEEIIRKMLS